MVNIWGKPIYVNICISHTNSVNVPVSIGHTPLALKLTNYPIFNYVRLPGQYFRYGM